MKNTVIFLQHSRHGVFTKKTLARASGLRFKSRCNTDNSPPCEPPKKFPDTSKPLNPEKCPTHYKGKKGCMPWDEAAELCPTKKPHRIDTQDDEICEMAHIQQNVAKKKEMNVCEKRLYERCLKLFQKPDYCLEQAKPRYGTVQKEYPMMHAVSKKSLPGAPKTSWQRLTNSKYPDCEE